MKLEIPKAMKAAHDELHADLEKAITAGGKTGHAARVVARVLPDHFVREEEFAMPPLALLLPLSEGKFDRAMADVLPMTDRLRAELSHMLTEHKRIVEALGELVAAARGEKQSDVEEFAQRLMLHAQTEDQVSYRAALLVGEAVRTKLNQLAGRTA
jgi:hypothetical protein